MIFTGFKRLCIICSVIGLFFSLALSSCRMKTLPETKQLYGDSTPAANESASGQAAEDSSGFTVESTEAYELRSEQAVESKEKPVSETADRPEETEKEVHSLILPGGSTLESRFSVPEGYTRCEYPAGSFGAFVRNYPLKPDGSPVLLWDHTQKRSQSDHAAVFAMAVEDELDVQQCADSVFRIYAEYFRASGQIERIRFHFVSGFLCDYNTYIQGYRVKVSDSEVNWILSRQPEESDAVFQEYMKIVSAYASTLSLKEESEDSSLSDLRIGDVFLKSGSPGHVVMVADIAEKDGRKAFLLAQGYMPAQEFHVIKNPRHENDPWYYEEEVTYPFRTQEYTFPEGSLKRPVY